MQDNTTAATVSTAVEPEPLDGAIRRTFTESLRGLGMSQNMAARAVGVNQGALSQWLQGKYPGNNEELTNKISAWLQKQAQPSRSFEPRSQTVVETTAYGSVCNVLAFCYAWGKMGLVDGEPGVGKTTAVKHFQGMYSNVWCLNACPTISTLMQVLRHLGYVIGLDQHWLTGGEQTQAIRKHITSRNNCLLIVDEAQNLDFRALEELRSIHDSTQVGLVLVGNGDLWHRMTGPQAGRYGQIRSRIQMRASAQRPTKADVERVAASYGVAESESIDLLRRAAANYGSLRIMNNVLAFASQGTGPTTGSIRSAMGMLGVAQ